MPPTKVLWVCSVCSATFSNKTEVKKHFDDNHTPTVVSGHLSAMETEDDMEDWLQCDFCSKSFPSNRGLLNHERAMHQAQRSKILAAIKAKTKSNRWTEDEVDRFKRLIQTFGLKSNKLLARKMGSKSVRQVEGFKQRFLQKHPLWRRFDYGMPALDSSPHPSSTDTSSSHSSPSLVAVTNEAPSPTTTDISSSDCERFIERITQPCLPPRAQSSLFNKADDLIIALRAPVPSLLLPSPEAVHRTAGPNLGTPTDQHTLVTSESQPLASVSLAPVEYERLRLDFTDRDYANNRESSLPSSLTTPELNPIQPQTESQDNDTTTDTITIAPAASQVIRSVISDIRRCFEAESDDTPQAGEQSHTGTEGNGVDRPMGGSSCVCVEGSERMTENAQPNREDGFQHQEGGQQWGGGRPDRPGPQRGNGGDRSFRSGNSRYRGHGRGGLNSRPLERGRPVHTDGDQHARGGQWERGSQSMRRGQSGRDDQPVKDAQPVREGQSLLDDRIRNNDQVIGGDN